MVELKVIPVGILSVNCYLLCHAPSHHCLIVDPGTDAAKIIKVIGDHDLQPQGVLLTHGHVDHISGLAPLCQKWPGLPVWIHPGDQGLYASPDNAVPPWIPAAENLPPTVAELPRLDAVRIEVIHTPGHTPGSVCFHLPDDNLLLTGDTLFRGTVGRTDFAGGSLPDLIHSLRQRLFLLPEETRVYPGHHAPTTIGKEKRNPRLGI